MNDACETDKTRMRAAFEKAAATYDAAAVLQREVGDRLIERLDIIKLNPSRVLDVGAGTGFCTFALGKHYPKAEVLALDIAHNMLLKARQGHGQYEYVVGDAEILPIADASIDMIFSNLTLQWCVDLNRVLSEFRRVLTPGGMLLFTTFGPDSLKELRACWNGVDSYTHVNTFIDMHNVGDALLNLRFAEPVMDVEHLTVTYKDAFAIMRGLKHIGAHNVSTCRPRTLTGKGQMQLVVDAYEKYREKGVLPVSYEVIYGHAWRPIEDRTKSYITNDISIPIEQVMGKPPRTQEP